jgi:hypothetical protein
MKYIVCHPEAKDHLFSTISNVCYNSYPDLYAGFPVRTSEVCDKWQTQYIPPSNKFIEYDESDYKWLKFFGFGYTKELVGEYAYYLIDV